MVYKPSGFKPRPRTFAAYKAQPTRVKSMVVVRRPALTTPTYKRRIPPIEKKWTDLAVLQTAIPAPADATGGELDPTTINCLNGISQGDTANSRDGNEVFLKSVYVKGAVQCLAQANQAAGDMPAKVYVALVLDTQTNSAQMNSEDCFTNPGANAVTAASPFRNLFFRKRFRILAQETLCFDNGPTLTWDGTNIEQSGMVRSFEFFKDLHNLPCNFVSGTTGTVASIVDNSLHIIAYCDSVSAVPAISYNSRVRFVG